MADSFVQLPPNSSGTKLRTRGPLPDGTHLEAILETNTDGDAFPESPATSHLSSTALAPAASVNLDAAILTSGRVGRLVMVTVAASVPLKAEISEQPSGTVRAVIFTTEVRLTEHWKTPHPDFIRLAAGGGARFRVRLTNLDISETADVYATCWFDEVTPTI